MSPRWWCRLPVLALACGHLCCAGPAPDTIRIGSKNFTEQIILGEILAQLIEDRTDLRVDRRFDLGGTFICHKALLAGELDMYVEYTGTALGAILQEPPSTDAPEVYDRVKRLYTDRFDLTWLSPLGFNNTFALVVRPEDAARYDLLRISDLARVRGTFRAGFGYEFIERADGYPGLTATYGFQLRNAPREMDLGLIYRALEQKQVDVVAGNSTDAPIDTLGLVVLEDDKKFFPPYDAAPVVRASTLERHPRLGAVLELLAGKISERRMRRMNGAVTSGGRSAREVAARFLREQSLTGQ
ncbi:MAG: glycine betaine ABC transporter substrate-binding protein [Acidobacteriota bacterium]